MAIFRVALLLFVKPKLERTKLGRNGADLSVLSQSRSVLSRSRSVLSRSQVHVVVDFGKSRESYKSTQGKAQFCK